MKIYVILLLALVSGSLYSGSTIDRSDLNIVNELCSKYNDSVNLFSKYGVISKQDYDYEGLGIIFDDFLKQYKGSIVKSYTMYMQLIEKYSQQKTEYIVVLSVNKLDYVSRTLAFYFLYNKKIKEQLLGRMPLVVVDYTGFTKGVEEIGRELKIPSPSLVIIKRSPFEHLGWKVNGKKMLIRCVPDTEIVSFVEQTITR